MEKRGVKLTPFQKHFFKTMAKSIGISPRGCVPARSSIAQFCEHLKHRGFRPETIIDVGVADGTFEIYSAFPAAKYLLMEPLQEFEPALRMISKRYDARYEIVAAGEREKMCRMHVGGTKSEKHGSFLVKSCEDMPYNGWEERSVKVERVDAVVERHALEGPYLLKVDTQGTELDVVLGAAGIFNDLEVVVLEASFYNFGQKQDQPLIGEVITSMSGIGYRPYDIFGGYGRPLDGALAQVDIAFVREDGWLYEDHRFSVDEETKPVSKRLLARCRAILDT